MGAGLLLMMTLPGLVLLLIVLAVVEHAASRLRRRSLITHSVRPGLTATSMDFMSVLTMPNKALELDERAGEKIRRIGSVDGAPEHRQGIDVDLLSGKARVARPSNAQHRP